MENMCSSIFTRLFSLSLFLAVQFHSISFFRACVCVCANHGCTITIFRTLFHSKYCIFIQFHIVAANYVKLIYFRHKLRRQQFTERMHVRLSDEMRPTFTALRFTLPSAFDTVYVLQLLLLLLGNRFIHAYKLVFTMS